MKYDNCDDLDLLAYLRSRLPNDERKAVERHLNTCARCRFELRELNQAEDQLALLLNPVTPPADLRANLLAKAYEQRPPATDGQRLAVQTAAHASYRSNQMAHSAKWRQVPYLVPWMLTTALFIVSVVLADQVERESVKLKTVQGQLAAASRAVDLQPTNVQAGATGKVVLMPSQSGLQLLVYISNVKPTTGSQVYHVWLLHHGARQSAGVMTVNSGGVGVLQVQLTGSRENFDMIGITLEPNPETTSPLGPKVLGTDQL